MSCLTDETVFDLLQGQITGSALVAAEQHLSTCGRCRAGVAASARLLGGSSASAPGVPSIRRRTLARGATIGRYIILESIGIGAAGVVYVAHDTSLKRRVALKILPGEHTEARARWLREAHAMAQVSHPNVVTVFDAGVHDDLVFIAMELVGGKTLAEWIAEKPRGWREVLPVFVDAARGLAAAHAAGFVHRDFKPHNVLVGDDGRARVTDFGLARLFGEVVPTPAPALPEGPVADGLTATGALVGTPAYMAPEQFAGRAVDARTDQFAFCVTLYEACCGQRPFAGREIKELAADVTRGLPPAAPVPAQLPPWLLEILRRGLASDPGRRYESMDALIAAVASGQAGETQRPRTRRAIAFITAAALLAAGATAWMLSLAAAGRCGNGVVEGTEECDDGNSRETDSCLNRCLRSRCGDGFVRAIVEECDDGNLKDGDTCSARCLACSGPNTHVGRNGHCYTRHDDPLPFPDARQSCQDEGGHLVTYTSGYELQDVMEAFLQRRPAAVWTAMARKDGKPAWDSPEFMPTGQLVIDWRSPPDATEGSCAIQEPVVSTGPLPAAGVWSPRPCREPAPFICERSGWIVRSQTGHAYQALMQRQIWKESDEACRKRGAHIVTVSSAEEHAFVRGIFAGQIWLAAVPDKQGGFGWNTGEPFVYSNFAANEPDGALPDSNCVAIDVDGMWHDRPCNNGYVTVCELD